MRREKALTPDQQALYEGLEVARDFAQRLNDGLRGRIVELERQLAANEARFEAQRIKVLAILGREIPDSAVFVPGPAGSRMAVWDEPETKTVDTTATAEAARS